MYFDFFHLFFDKFYDIIKIAIMDIQIIFIKFLKISQIYVDKRTSCVYNSEVITVKVV